MFNAHCSMKISYLCSAKREKNEEKSHFCINKLAFDACCRSVQIRTLLQLRIKTLNINNHNLIN